MHHLDEEAELGEEVPGDSLGDDVVVLDVGAGDLLVDVINNLLDRVMCVIPDNKKLFISWTATGVITVNFLSFCLKV